METPLKSDPRWYCLRAKPKHEHIAAAHLRLCDGIEVYCPRVRIQRSTRRGLVWFTEALFPNYLFARFDLAASRTLVRYSSGVSSIVHFGDQIAEVPESAIQELTRIISGDDVRILEFAVAEGDDVSIVSGPLAGQEGTVIKILPAQERVRVLLDFLGTPREVELGLLAIFNSSRTADSRVAAFA